MKKKLLKNIKKEFIELIESGKNYKYISEKLNISKTTYYTWKKLITNESSRKEILDETENLKKSFRKAIKDLSTSTGKTKNFNEILKPVFDDIENLKELIKNIGINEENTDKLAELKEQINKIKESITEEQLKTIEARNFSKIRQGTATNTLTKVKANTKRNTIMDPITKIAKIMQKDFCITIPNFMKFTGFRTSTYQLLDALTTVLTETGTKNPTVVLSLEEYMAKRGLKDKKEARKQVTEDLDALFNTTISFKEKTKNGQTRDFQDIRIIDSKGIRKGIINVSFGMTFYKILSGYPVMPYPAQLWAINGKRNPNSFYLLRKISEHKNMNIGKKNEDIISVATLLQISPNIPAYEDVMKANEHPTRRIKEPFERDMDALKETLTWTYCHSNNTPLTDEEIKNLNYNTFIKLLVKIDWNQYPNQISRLIKAAEEKEKNN